LFLVLEDFLLKEGLKALSKKGELIAKSFDKVMNLERNVFPAAHP
jgi:hypothetical protein